MTGQNSTLAPALHRALGLLADPPAQPDAGKGYLDLLASAPAQDAAGTKNSGPLQAWFASPVGSMVYDYQQASLRRLFTAWLQPTEWLSIPAGGIALDVGCGPGSVTTSLARAVVPDGLTLGVDISAPVPHSWGHVFGEDELGDVLESHGFISVRTKSSGIFQSVRGKRG